MVTMLSNIFFEMENLNFFQGTGKIEEKTNIKDAFLFTQSANQDSTGVSLCCNPKQNKSNPKLNLYHIQQFCIKQF